MSLQDFTRTTGTKINKIGAGWMLHPDTGKRGEEIGLDMFAYYALGRGGVLGNVESDVVASAFFFFDPTLVAGIWNAAKEKADPREAALHYAGSCCEWGRARISDVADLDTFCKLAQRVTEAADVRGLSLFAGWREVPLPDDPAGSAMQLLHVLRELRGGANGIATRALGLSAAEAVSVNSPHMLQLFGWTEAADPEPLRDRMARAEDITDDIVGPAFAVLDEGERQTFAAVVDACAQAVGI